MLSLRAQLILILTVFTLALAAALGGLAYSTARGIVVREAERTVGLAANARKQTLLAVLERQRDRAGRGLEAGRAACDSEQEERTSCLRRWLGSLVAIEGATAGQLTEYGTTPIATGEWLTSLVVATLPTPLDGRVARFGFDEQRRPYYLLWTRSEDGSASLADTSRLEAGRLTIDRRVENLSEILARVVEQARARTSRHQLLLSAPPDVRPSVDSLRLEQVVANLLENAIKFSPAGGPIEVELSTPTAGVARLVVRDHGLGIPPEHRERIFDRFHQAHASEHRSGMGIGLYVSRDIVELHGGRITAEFPADGGTRFVVTLPTGLEPVTPPPFHSRSPFVLTEKGSG
jgi:anti-sigma regulatory factor (Ser/Thr protein kinase)